MTPGEHQAQNPCRHDFRLPVLHKKPDHPQYQGQSGRLPYHVPKFRLSDMPAVHPVQEQPLHRDRQAEDTDQA